MTIIRSIGREVVARVTAAQLSNIELNLMLRVVTHPNNLLVLKGLAEVGGAFSRNEIDLLSQKVELADFRSSAQLYVDSTQGDQFTRLDSGRPLDKICEGTEFSVGDATSVLELLSGGRRPTPEAIAFMFDRSILECTQLLDRLFDHLRIQPNLEETEGF